MTDKKLYPVGTIVYLKKGTLKLVILARGQLVTSEVQDSSLPVYYDYLAGLYPQGYDTNHMYYFNTEDIDQLVFKGYTDNEEKRYQEVIEEWQQSHVGDYVQGKSDEQDGKEMVEENDESQFNF